MKTRTERTRCTSKMVENEVVRLNQLVNDKDQEIKSLKKQLIAYRLLKQQVKQLFTIIEIDKE
ncbi:hypothetical protein C2G38_2210446 [Gigaspora rosea]|uniref:Uncharacterized protein n=1 Tax=Gigaspora rosea TaxID=44941 RepID=A0A397UIF3_9GLOM|nr:hypothetical protein C2G38_2210446 [Gigaspora rosea]